MSQPEFEDLRDRSGVFAEISAAWPISANLTGGDRPERVEAVAVSPGYFGMLGAKAQLGRVFGPEDRAEGFAEAAILSDGLWRRLYGGDPRVLGRKIRLDDDLYTIVGVGPQPIWLTIVGVVGTVKSENLEAPDAPHLYFPAYQRSGIAMTMFVRTAGDPGGLAESLRREVQAVDPDLPVFGVRTMEEVVSKVFAQRRFQLQMIGAFAAVALLLAALGIYGVTSFWVSQRTQEIGIRLALGARGGDVVGMVMKQGVQLTLWGIVAGLAGALPLSGLLRGLLFGTSFFDPATFAAIAALLLTTASVACYLPARRATRVDPMRALRSE